MKDQRQPTPGERVERMFARRLRDLRAERGLSQAALAEKVSNLGLKMDDLAILRIEKNDDGLEGARRVRLGEATLIAKALGVRLDEMLRETKSTEVRAQELEAELATLRAASLRSEEQIVAMQTRRAELLEQIKQIEKLFNELRNDSDGAIFRNQDIEYDRENPRARLIAAANPQKMLLNRTLQRMVRPLLTERFWLDLSKNSDVSIKAPELRVLVVRKVAEGRLGYHQAALDAVESIAKFAGLETVPTLGSSLEGTHKRLVTTSRRLVEAAVDLLDSTRPDAPEKAARFREELRQFISTAESYVTQLAQYIMSNPSKGL